MALTINTNIVNDADGYLLNASNVNVKVGEQSGQRVMLDAYLADAEQVVAGKEDIPERTDTLPVSGPLVKNTMYYLGEIEESISIAFPDNLIGGDKGDWLYLNYNTPSDNVPTVTVDTTHSIGLDMVDWTMESCSYTAMAMWDGAEWVFAYRTIDIS